MTRQKSDARHQAILDAALALFSGYGYRRTSVGDVAREAGIAKGTVYLYFENKEALFAAVCRHVADRFLARARDAAASDRALEDKIRTILSAKFSYLYQLVHSSPHAGEIIASKNQLASEVFRQADREFEQILASALAAGQERGEIELPDMPARDSESARKPGNRPDDAETATAWAGALLIRCAFGNGASGADQTPPTLEQYNQRLADMTRVVLAGLRTGPAR